MIFTEKSTVNLKINIQNSEELHSWSQYGRRYVYCKACVAHPEIVNRYKGSQYRKLPPITTIAGTQFRNDVVKEHFCTQFHIESVKAMRLKLIGEKPTEPQPILDAMVSKANEKQANTIGSLALSVFNDAKRLTLAAWNWPSRVISFQLGKMFNFNSTTTSTENLEKVSLEYVNPGSHAEILQCIVDSNKNSLIEKIKDSLSVSLRCDGSVDRTNIDKIYVLAKIVTKHGNLETIFIGTAAKTERQAEGLMNAVKRTISSHGNEFYQIMLQKISSFVTDGAPENVGSHKALLKSASSLVTVNASQKINTNKKEPRNLWKLLDDEILASGSNIKVMKIWCAAHRVELVWKNSSKAIKEIHEVFVRLTDIASSFHVSALRYAELKQIAKEHNIQLLQLPKFFEVRWSEFTYSLVHAVLVSWHCLILYFEATKADLVNLNYLKNFKKLQLISFIADVLFIFQRYQKKIQADNLNLISLHQYIKELCAAIEDLKSKPLLGGWESTLQNTVVKEDLLDDDGQGVYTVKLKNIDLSTEEIEKRGAHNKKRHFEVVRTEIVETLLEIINNNFEFEDELIKLLIPFVKFDKENVKMFEFHEKIAPDLDISSLSLQFNELCEISQLREFNIPEVVSHLAKNDINSSYSDVLTVFARLAAATPSSADVERSISANNLLKTSMRSSLKLETENNYLHVHYNMPTLTEWEPKDAVVRWLNLKQRRKTNLTVKNVEKSQQHFMGVFPEAKKRKETCDLEESSKTEQKVDNKTEEVSIPLKKRRNF